MSARSRMRSVEFRREREPSWVKLEQILGSVRRVGLGGLGPRQLAQLPVLHRAVLSSLSVARAISLDRNVLEYLESLAARSYFCVYGTRRSLFEELREFAWVRFPRAVREARWPLALSAACLLLGVALGFLLTLDDPSRYDALVSSDLAQDRSPATSTEDLRAVLYSDDELSAATMLAHFASFLFTHNARIGMLCFALGFAAGIPVLLLLIYNGLTLGALAAVYHTRGLSLDFWGWVMPHGVTELGAIALCGAAGFVLGQAVVFPGRRSRLAELAHRGRRAGLIVAGTVAMFFLAALIEGFFRQLVHSVPVRYTVVAATGVAWWVYFTKCGRRAAT